jgi:hypothetical protein
MEGVLSHVVHEVDQEEVEEECLDHQTCINVNSLISLPPNMY